MRLSIISFLILSSQAAIAVAQSESTVDSVVVERTVPHQRNRIPITKRRLVDGPSATLVSLSSTLGAAGFYAASADSTSTLATCPDGPRPSLGFAIAVYSRGGMRRIVVPDDCEAVSNNVDVAASLRQVGWDVLRGRH